jgi:hypothetical protein
MGIIATPIFYLLVMLSSGGGHSYVSMMLFFPFGTFAALAADIPSWLFLSLMSLQFPIYGMILTLAYKRNLLRRAKVILLTIHFLAVVICLIELPATTFEKSHQGSAPTGSSLRASKQLPA